MKIVSSLAHPTIWLLSIFHLTSIVVHPAAIALRSKRHVNSQSSLCLFLVLLLAMRVDLPIPVSTALAAIQQFCILAQLTDHLYLLS